jgi:hypothetical protein
MTTDKQSYIHVGTEGVIRRYKSKEDRQCNGLKKNDHLHVCMIVCLWSFFFRQLHCLSSFDLYLLITPSVPTLYVWLFVFGHFSLGHYIVCPLLIEDVNQKRTDNVMA